MNTQTFNIFNRRTGLVQFTASIECAEDAPLRIKAGFALKWAYTSGADLRGADLRDADLRGADLRGAVLRGADLRGADLRDARVIFAGVDSRGYEFYLTADKTPDRIVIQAGCKRWTTFAEARAYYGPSYAGTGTVPELLAKLDLLEAVARARGYL